MRGAIRERAWLILVAVALSCYDFGDGYERFPRVEGGLCSSLIPSRCVDSERLLDCYAREWTVRDCATVCVEQGLYPVDNGCVRRPEEDFCLCTPFHELCTRMTVCDGPDQLAVCVDGHWTTHDCADVCAAQEPPRMPLRCEDSPKLSACACTLEGAPCTEQALRCDDLSSLAVCMDGAWILEDCSSSCAAGQSGHCRTVIDDDDEPTAICACL